MDKKRFVWVFLLLALVSIVFAETSKDIKFSAEISPSRLVVRDNETGSFVLKISQNSQLFEFFELYSPDVIWDVRTADQLKVPPRESFETKVSVRPLNLGPGIYNVPLVVRRQHTNDLERLTLAVEVLSSSPPTTGYLPAVRGTATITPVDPRRPVLIELDLKNQNKRAIEELIVKGRSKFINFDESVSLKPLERKTVKITTAIDPFTPPEKDVLQIKLLTVDDKTYHFDIDPVYYAVQSYGRIEEKTDVANYFLKSVRTITLFNNGNNKQVGEHILPAGVFRQLFTSSTPPSSRQGKFLVWNVDLDVGETKSVRVVTNYRPLAFLLAVIIIGAVIYFIFRSPVTVKKRASVLSTREGGISELKIMLNVTNRSNKRATSVRLIDSVPKLGEIVRDYDPGTLEPVKIVQDERKGTVIKWEIDALEPKEERIVTYKLKTKFSVLGGMSLPISIVKFTSQGKERSSKSNTTTVSF